MNTILRTVGIGAIALVVAIGMAACTGSDDTPDEGNGGGKKSGKPPVLSSFVLDAGTETPQDVRVAVHGVRRIAGATVLDWSVTPLASDTAKAGDKVGQELDINVDPGLDNSNALQLVDTTAKKVYRPLDNDDRIAPGDNPVAGCLCVPWFKVKNDLTVGTTRLMQAAFPELPAGLDEITVSIRNQPLVSDAPVAPEGEVSTGKSIDLNAKADELPTAGAPATFTYPVGDGLQKPVQAMSLTINQVIAGPSGTSLIYTVKAEQDGPGIDAFGGRPINDPEVVAYGTTLYAFGSSGPAVAPGGAAAAAKLVRPWFASVKQKTAKPPSVPPDFTWRECLCTHTQFYGKFLATKGRSITLIEHMPALPTGTTTTDIVFPDKSLPTVTGVKVTEAPKVTGSSKKADVGTWAYGSVETGDLPTGWELKEWPTPVPDTASITDSEAVVDDLEEVFSDDVSIEKKEKKKVEVTLDSTVSFQPDSAKLTAKAMTTIKRIAEDISKAGSSVVIEGHVSGTDQGSKAVQQKLSEERAQAVLKALKSAVGGDVTFKAVGRGAEEPVAPNDSEEHRKLNRRVVVTYDR